MPTVPCLEGMCTERTPHCGRDGSDSGRDHSAASPQTLRSGAVQLSQSVSEAAALGPTLVGRLVPVRIMRSMPDRKAGSVALSGCMGGRGCPCLGVERVSGRAPVRPASSP